MTSQKMQMHYEKKMHTNLRKSPAGILSFFSIIFGFIIAQYNIFETSFASLLNNIHNKRTVNSSIQIAVKKSQLNAHSNYSDSSAEVFHQKQHRKIFRIHILIIIM